MEGPLLFQTQHWLEPTTAVRKCAQAWGKKPKNVFLIIGLKYVLFPYRPIKTLICLCYSQTILRKYLVSTLYQFSFSVLENQLG